MMFPHDQRICCRRNDPNILAVPFIFHPCRRNTRRNLDKLHVPLWMQVPKFEGINREETLLHKRSWTNQIVYSPFFYSALLCSSPLCSPFSSSALLYQTFLYSCLLCSIILSFCLLLCSSLLYSSLPCPCLLYPSVFCFLYLDIFCSIPPSAFCSLLFFTPPSSTLLLVYSSLFCSSPLYSTPTLPFPTLFVSALLDLHHTDPTKFL